MFAYILERISRWFDNAEQQRYHDYLAGSANIADLEARMRAIMSNGYPR